MSWKDLLGMNSDRSPSGRRAFLLVQVLSKLALDDQLNMAGFERLWRPALV